MGVGKSTVAHALEKLSGMEIIDMDDELVRRAGKSIPEIFDKDGQGAFRSMETALLRELATKRNCIISCGGGVILREENRRLMKESGMVVELTAEPEIIYERVKDDDNRPVLAGKKNVPAIRVLLEERKGNYELARDVSVPTDGRTALEIAAEILERMKERS
jgi:shikimate kinase